MNLARRVDELVGYFIDVTAAVKAREGEAANVSIRAAAVTCAPIEHAKGSIAFAVGIDAEVAFERREHVRRHERRRA